MRLTVRFDTPLIAKELNEKEWQLMAPLLATIWGDHNFYVEVPIGFVTDFASVPRLPFIYTLFGGKAKKPATLHDYLYAHGSTPLDKKIADEVLFAAMVTNGNNWYQRWGFYLAVRIFGGTHFKFRTVTPALEIDHGRNSEKTS